MVCCCVTKNINAAGYYVFVTHDVLCNRCRSVWRWGTQRLNNHHAANNFLLSWRRAFTHSRILFVMLPRRIVFIVGTWMTSCTAYGRSGQAIWTASHPIGPRLTRSLTFCSTSPLAARCQEGSWMTLYFPRRCLWTTSGAHAYIVCAPCQCCVVSEGDVFCDAWRRRLPGHEGYIYFSYHSRQGNAAALILSLVVFVCAGKQVCLETFRVLWRFGLVFVVAGRYEVCAVLLIGS